MKKILLSVRPKWCELIFSGKKKIEVREDKPLQVQVPFEVLVWCTKGKYSIIQNIHTPTIKANGLYKLPNGTIQNGWEGNIADYHKVETGPRLLHCGIIGSFICDKITRYEGDSGTTIHTSVYKSRMSRRTLQNMASMNMTQ